MADNIYRSFRTFLRENDYERQFDAAFYTQCGANYLDQHLADILVIDEFFFGRCFDWSKTPEGRNFWNEVNRRWWEQWKLKNDGKPFDKQREESKSPCFVKG